MEAFSFGSLHFSVRFHILKLLEVFEHFCVSDLHIGKTCDMIILLVKHRLQGEYK